MAKKRDISFLHVSGALCYSKNDRDDIEKLGAKGDIGIFIGYSATSCAYRTPTNSATQSPNIPITSQDVGNLPQQHVQQQDNQAPLQPKTVADNVQNAMFDANTFVIYLLHHPQVLLNHHVYNM
ncbi:hypothetical protein Tco_1392966 [Tanacetum coccineum]